MPFLIDSSQGAEKSHGIYKNITQLGSDQDSDIQIVAEGVAPDHARIVKEGDDFFISASGRGKPLLVNGKKEKRVKLKEGDEVTIGSCLLRFALHSIPETQDGVSPAISSVLHAYKEILDFSRSLQRSTSVQDVLDTLLDQIVDLTRADKSFLIFLEGEERQVKASRNIEHKDITDALSQLSDSIIDRVIQDQEPFITGNALNDPEFSGSASVMSLKVSSVMCVPLKEANEILGVIYLGGNQITSRFDAETLDIVTVFAAQASLVLRNALLLNNLRSDNSRMKEDLRKKRFGEVIGSSDVMQEVFRTVRKVAPTNVSVLLTGASGTGKELIARELHDRSDRADGPFVVVNCGAIPENLIESELFGHLRGAFTGAIATRIGHFQAADGGTLFLDEIGELPVAMQVKLLRALQEKKVSKVGDTRLEPVDIRVISATNVDLEQAIKDSRFREDLYYRLNVVGIHLPPLSDRGEDITAIARFLLHRYVTEYSSKVKGFSPQAMMFMKKYEWMGDIRELENRIKKAVIMSDRVQLSPEDLELNDDMLDPIQPLAQAREEWQRNYIDDVLIRNNGNRTKTAQDLGVDPRTIFRHLEKEEQPAG